MEHGKRIQGFSRAQGNAVEFRLNLLRRNTADIKQQPQRGAGIFTPGKKFKLHAVAIQNLRGNRSQRRHFLETLPPAPMPFGGSITVTEVVELIQSGEKIPVMNLAKIF